MVLVLVVMVGLIGTGIILATDQMMQEYKKEQEAKEKFENDITEKKN